MRPTDHDSSDTTSRLRRPHRFPAGLLAVALLAALSVEAGAETRITPRFSIDGSVTDNVLGANEGGEEGDAFTILQPGFSITNRGGRSRLDMSYGLSLDRYVDRTELNSENHDLTAIGSYDVIRDQVSIDARAGITRVVTDRTGAISATDRNLGSNQTETLTYSLSPSWVTGFSNVAVSNLTYSFGQTIFEPFGSDDDATGTATSSGGSDSTINELSYNLSSGRLFSRLGWTWSSNFVRTGQEGGSETDSANSDATLSYTVNRFVTPRAAVGYERFRGGGDSNDFSGVTWSVGLRATPGPRTDIDLEYGRQFDDTSIQGTATFRVTPTINLTASATHRFSVQQAQINDGLQNIAVDEDGNFIDATTGLPFDPNGSAVDLSEVNNVVRTKTYNLAMSGARGRNNYGVTAGLTDQSNNASGRDTMTLSSSVTYGRSLSPNAGLNLSASISSTEDSSTTDTTTYNFQAGLNYVLGSNLSGSASYSYVQRDSSTANSDLMENVITARLLVTF